MRWMSGHDDNYKRWWWRWSLLSRQPTPAASFLHHWWYCKLVDSGPTCPAHNYHYHDHYHYHDGNDDTFEHKSWFCSRSRSLRSPGRPRAVHSYRWEWSTTAWWHRLLTRQRQQICTWCTFKWQEYDTWHVTCHLLLVWHSSMQLRSQTLTYPRYSTSL